LILISSIKINVEFARLIRDPIAENDSRIDGCETAIHAGDDPRREGEEVRADWTKDLGINFARGTTARLLISLEIAARD